MRRTNLKDPDMIELLLIGILAIWTISTFYLLRTASTLANIEMVSWTSLTAFFSGFGTIVLLVIAVLVADIRKGVIR